MIEQTGMRQVAPARLRRWGNDGADTMVLALHSLGLDGGSFDAMARCQPLDGMRWLALDMRGHGRARDDTAFTLQDCVADAAVVLRDSGARRVHLLGHSMGGVVAALLAARCIADDTLPQAVSLTLLASPPAGAPVFLERGRQALQQGMAVAAEDTLRRWFGDPPQADAVYVQAARQSLLTMWAEGYDASWRALASFGGYAALAQVLPPTLAVAARQDLSTPPAVMQRIGQAFEQAERGDAFALHEEDGGHMFPLTPSGALAQRLATHWNHPEQD